MTAYDLVTSTLIVMATIGVVSVLFWLIVHYPRATLGTALSLAVACWLYAAYTPPHH
jgi:hypothetical protein